MRKLLIDNKVYIPVCDIPDEDIKQTLLNGYECGFYGLCKTFINDSPLLLVSEEDYNNFLLCLGRDCFSIELTKVESLSSNISSVKAIRPLKYMTLSSLGLDDEAIEKRIAREEREEFEKCVAKLTAVNSDALKYYNKTVDWLNKNDDELRDILDELGLSLKGYTIIDGNKNMVYVTMYLAGQGIFYEIDDDSMNTEFFRTLEWNIGGKLNMLDVYDETEEGIISVPRMLNTPDFSKMSALESVAWCVQNLDVKNDFSDEINYNQYDEEGVNFFVSVPILVKLFNKNAFKNYLLFDGIPEIKESVIQASKPEP